MGRSEPRRPRNEARVADAADSAAGLYSSDELDAMALAHNYCRWIVAQWRPYLRGRVLELGAGTGNFSRFLLEEPIKSLLCIEPARNLFETVERRLGGDRRVTLRCGMLDDCLPELRGAPVDVALSVNVLEHIEDDRRVLRGLKESVVPGGAVLLLVPALPLLYGAADETFGHVRRYTRAGLTERLQAAGLSITSIRYFNFLGAFAWFTAGRLLRRRTLTPAMVKISDATLIPLTQRLERLIVPPFGQSLIVVARA